MNLFILVKCHIIIFRCSGMLSENLCDNNFMCYLEFLSIIDKIKHFICKKQNKTSFIFKKFYFVEV